MIAISRGVSALRTGLFCGLWLLSTLTTPPTHAQTAGLSCQPCPGTPLPAGMCTVEETHLEGTGCDGFDNCQEPQAVPAGIEVIDQGDGTFEARLPVDVTAPYNSHPETLSFAKLQLY